MACVANANNQRPARLELSKHILNCRRVSVRTRHKATIISFGGPIRTGLICFVHPVYTKRSHRPPRTRIAQEYLRQVDTPRTGCCTTFDVPPGKKQLQARHGTDIYTFIGYAGVAYLRGQAPGPSTLHPHGRSTSKVHRAGFRCHQEPGSFLLQYLKTGRWRERWVRWVSGELRISSAMHSSTARQFHGGRLPCVPS